jgi:hypothetical protein
MDDGAVCHSACTPYAAGQGRGRAGHATLSWLSSPGLTPSQSAMGNGCVDLIMSAHLPLSLLGTSPFSGYLPKTWPRNPPSKTTAGLRTLDVTWRPRLIRKLCLLGSASTLTSSGFRGKHLLHRSILWGLPSWDTRNEAFLASECYCSSQGHNLGRSRLQHV